MQNSKPSSERKPVADRRSERVVVMRAEGEAACSAIEGKFLLLRRQGVDGLLFCSGRRHRYHNQMLAEYLDRHAIPTIWTDPQTLTYCASGLSVKGGGRFRVDPARGRLELWGDSSVYGAFDRARARDCLLCAGHLWSEYDLRLDP